MFVDASALGDADAKRKKVIEIKPNTPTGIKTGEIRKKFLESHGFEFEVDILYYDPEDYIKDIR